MDDTAKYLIHAAITADGVVERSDVVGAIFGQTEGLLGDELDLRDLQQSSKVGRIDVEIDSEGGQSFGHVTIASSLDRVETSILAASLETITRVGPCRSEVRVTEIEDVREAKRREVVERAKELLAESFDESIMTSTEILDEVRESVRVEDITEYEGLPAGPHVAESDAIIVVEGRADVLTLLKYGIKNAVAVEGTNVPDAIATLTQERTVTTFLDGDRGGELILRELAQVGDVDYVAFAPESQSVEDLGRSTVMSALRDKVPYETFATGDDGTRTGVDAETTAAAIRAKPLGDASEADAADETDETDAAAGTDDTGTTGGTRTATETTDTETDTGEGDGTTAVAETDGAGTAAPDGTVSTGATGTVTPDGPEGADRSTDTADAEDAADGTGPDGTSSGEDADVASETADDENADAESDTSGEEDIDGSGEEDDGAVGTLRGVARDVIAEETGEVRLTDDSFREVASGEASEAFELLKTADEVPYALFVDGEVTQRLVDVAAQRGTEHVVGRSVGEFVKRPVSVRIRTVEQLLGPRPAGE
ncbi:DNA primase DnaG [Salinigranum salinum]|uniref:DNA primase DnaG n=1 Tax=Salinigranum salinum TaxID=1364937 RepID=UPI001260A1B0|nr:DNA primase DnaG [Salinigranum salinum]